MTFFGFRFGVIALSGLSALALAPCVSGQTSSSDSVFTISVAAGTSSKDVQVRFFLTDNSGHLLSSTSEQQDGNIVIKSAGKPAHSFKGMAYAPGCQFVSYSVSDLAASDRHSDFQCQPLSSVPFQGSISTAQFPQKQLQVEILYDAELSDMPNTAVSPFSLGTASVDADGTFSFDLPAFANDPALARASSAGSFTFFLTDAQSGKRLGKMTPSYDVLHNGAVQVESSYPAMTSFVVQSPNER